MPGDHDRDQQDADRDGEQAALQVSFVTRRAANPTPTTKTISSMVPRWKRKSPHGMVPQKVTAFILPIMFPKIDSLFFRRKLPSLSGPIET